MKQNVTNSIEQKYKLGLMLVIVLGIITFIINTMLINSISEDIRISITSFFAAALCVLGLKYFIYRLIK